MVIAQGVTAPKNKKPTRAAEPRTNLGMRKRQLKLPLWRRLLRRAGLKVGVTVGTILAAALVPVVKPYAMEWMHDASWKIRPTPVNLVQKVAAQTVMVKLEPEGSGSAVLFKRKNDSGDTRIFAWTAAHVTDTKTEYSVIQVAKVHGEIVAESKFEAFPIFVDRAYDVALLWVAAPDVFASYAKFDRREVLPVGTRVCHVGNMLGTFARDTYAEGVVSAHNVSQNVFRGSPLERAWLTCDQTSLIIFGGSSGGGLFAMDNGRLVGLTTGVGVIGFGTPACSLTYFVPVRVLRHLALDNDLPWATAKLRCPDDFILRVLRKKVADNLSSAGH